MNSQTFKLKPKVEFIPLMNLLKLLGIAQTGGHAKIMIDEGEVMVNGAKEYQKRKKLRKDDVVQVDGVRIMIE